MPPELEEMLAKTDALVQKAQGAVNSAARDIRKEILYLAGELNIGGSADAREVVYAKVAKRIATLGNRLDALLTSSNELAARAGVEAVSSQTGVTVAWSRKRAREIVGTAESIGGRGLAATMTAAMEGNIIDALRNATVSAMREQALTGGTNRELQELLLAKWTAIAKDPANLAFVDRSGRTWDTKTYLNMNARTNAARVYNDSMASAFVEAGHDLAMVSAGGDPNCPKCFPWEGRILSITGKTKGFPSYEQARAAGCFHPNCVHTLEYVDEDLDADEIGLQRQFAPPEDLADSEAMDEQRYQIDIARKMQAEGMDATQARIAVDRDNLANSIRQGLIREDAEEIVAAMSDEQVNALCPNGNPPAFHPAKDADGEEGWRRGKRGGVVYIGSRRNPITAERLAQVTGIGAGTPTKPSGTNVPKSAKEAEDKRREEGERRRKKAAEARAEALLKRAQSAKERAVRLRMDFASAASSADAVVRGLIAYGAEKGLNAAEVLNYVGEAKQISAIAQAFNTRQQEVRNLEARVGGLPTITGATADELTASADTFEKELKVLEAQLAELGEKSKDSVDQSRKAVALVEGGRMSIDAIVRARKSEDGADFKRKTAEDIGLTAEEARRIRTEASVEEAVAKTGGLNDGFEVLFKKAEADALKVNEAIIKEREEAQARHRERVQPLTDAINSVNAFKKPVEEQIASGLDFIRKSGMEKEYEKYASKYYIHSDVARRNVVSRFIWEKRKKLEKENEKELVAIDVKRKNGLVEASPIYALAPDSTGTVAVGDVSKSREETWKVAKRVIERIVDKSVLPNMKVHVNAMRGDRAYQTGATINLAARNGADTYAHEYAHFIEEWNPHVHERCQEFLRYRAEKSGDEAKSLRILTGNSGYKSDERAIKDNFFNPYCGKIYADGGWDGRKPDSVTTETGNAGYRVHATEILSMGLERLLNDAQGFYREDREYFDFTLNLLQGRI